MRQILKIFSVVFVFTMILSCKKDNNKVNVNNYPSELAGNWVTFEFQGGNLNGAFSAPFDMVTSLDPDSLNNLIIDKMYASDSRVRAEYNSTLFKSDTNLYPVDTINYDYIEGYIRVNMGKQLEKISTNTYNIAFITVDGNISSNPVLINFCYQLARASYSNISFSESDIKDVILLHAGYYDKYKNLIDTTLVMGYRRTGFEDVQH